MLTINFSWDIDSPKGTKAMINQNPVSLEDQALLLAKVFARMLRGISPESANKAFTVFSDEYIKPMTGLEIEYAVLCSKLRYHSDLYYNGTNQISDYEYDMMYRELLALEREHPELVTSHSPTQKVGAQTR